jgi:hypothetical protein
MSGKLNTTLSYNTDVIQPGNGIFIDRSIKNQIKLVNRNQAIGNFMLCKNSSGYLLTDTDNGTNQSSTTNNNTLVLGTYNNYFKQKNQFANPSTLIETFQDNLYINIDDSNVPWSKGQTMKIVFDGAINMNGLNIVIRTDQKNKYGQGSFGKIITIIKPTQLISNKPIIEIYCEDDSTYSFGLDILR